MALDFQASNPGIETVLFNRSGSAVTATIVPRLNATGTNNITFIVRRGNVQDSITVPVLVDPVADAPTISRLVDRTTPSDVRLDFPILVQDPDTDITKLQILAESLNPSVISSTNITFGGISNFLASLSANADAGTWTNVVRLVPNLNQQGTATIRITVTDTTAGGSSPVSSTFVLTVTPVNHEPTISAIDNKAIQAGGSTTNISFTVGDPDNDTLTITATSDNQALVRDADIVVNTPTGAPGSRTVRVTAQRGLTDVGSAVITLTVKDPGGRTAVTKFTVNIRPTRERVFANTDQITINANGPASPYPSVIPQSGQTISGFVGNISSLTVTLERFAHSFPDDVDVLLVGPTGVKVVIMSDVGGGNAVTNVTLRLDDSAADALPGSAALASGTFRPFNEDSNTDNFPSPAPAAPYGSSLSAFNGTSPNGTWSLYIVDDIASDGGVVVGGWSIGITTQPTLVGLTGEFTQREDNPITIPFTIAEEAFGDPSSFKFTFSSTNASLLSDISVFGSGTNRTLTLQPSTNRSGTTLVTVTAENSDAQQFSATFRATFTADNDSPVITPVPIPDQTLSIGSFLTLTNVSISDAETDQKDLLIEVTSSNPNVLPSSSVVLIGNNLSIFTGTTAGETDITIRVTDPTGLTTRSSFRVVVSEGINPVFAKNEPITIVDKANASPYPSTIEVRGVNGSVRKVVVTLTGVSHRYPDDVDVLLVGPHGEKVVLMSDAGAGGNPQSFLTNAWITFDDEAATAVPDNSPIQPFTAYRPFDYETSSTEFPSAPAGPVSTTLNGAFNGINPNGTWSLYVVDDASPDAGTIGNWVLNIALNEVGPVLTGLTNVSGSEDTLIEIPFTVGSSDLNGVTFDVSAANTDLVSSVKVAGAGATRSLQINVNTNANGTSLITVRGTDAAGTRIRQFTLTVTPQDDPPVFAAVDDVRISGVANVVLNITDLDTPLSELTFLASTTGAGLIEDVQFSVSGNSVIARIAPATGVRGTEVLTISVSDGTTSVSQMFNVTVGPTGGPQFDQAIPDVTTSPGQNGVVRFTVSDPDTDIADLAFFASTQGGTLVQDVRFTLISANTVEMTIIPAAGQSGSEQITISVSDGSSTARSMFRFTVAAPGPIIGPIGDVTTTANATVTIPITVTDSDTPLSQLTLFASTTNPGLVRDVTFITVGTNTTATIALVTNASGTAEISVRASDGTTSVTRTFRITVTDACEPPVIAAIADQTASGTTLTVTVSVTDSDDAISALTFNASTAGGTIVTGVTFTPTATGATATFTLAAGATGTETVTVLVSDGCSSASEMFTITVGGGQVTPPISVGFSGTNLVVSVNGEPNTTVVIEGSSDLRSWTPVGFITLDANGNGQLTLSATGRSRFFRTRTGAVAPAPAPLAYEGFDYAPGTSISTNTAGGTGWLAPWEPDVEGPATNHVVRAPGLGYVDASGRSLVTSGGAAFFSGTNLTSGDLRAFRTLSASRTNGSTWVSFIGMRSGPTTTNAANPYPRAANISFYNGATESFAIGNASGSVSNFWTVLPQGSAASVTNAQRSSTPFNQQALIVLRIDHKGGNADDLFMWVNPALGAEPSTNAANARSTGAFNFSFDRIRPFVGGLDSGNARPGSELTIDEFRVGTSFASVTPHNVRLDVTQPGYATTVVNGTDTGAAPPANEGVIRVIDNAGQKYLNFTKRGSGFTVATPAATLVTGIRLWTANDAVERDPASYKLEGSTTGAAGPWTVISEGALALPAGRNAGGTATALAGGNFQEVGFSNTTQYNAYRVTFPLVKNTTTANSMQIAEVELLGPVLP